MLNTKNITDKTQKNCIDPDSPSSATLFFHGNYFIISCVTYIARSDFSGVLSEHSDALMVSLILWDSKVRLV